MAASIKIIFVAPGTVSKMILSEKKLKLNKLTYLVSNVSISWKIAVNSVCTIIAFGNKLWWFNSSMTWFLETVNFPLVMSFFIFRYG